MKAPTYWCVYTFGTEYMDDFHLRGLFTKREDADEFAATLEPGRKPAIVEQPHAQLVEDIARNYLARTRSVVGTGA